MVGIPGHIIDPNTKKIVLPLDAIASKTEFDPYGTKADMPDPVAHAINSMLAHIHAMDQQIASMQKEMNEAGIKCTGTPICDLNGCEIEDGYVKEVKL